MKHERYRELLAAITEHDAAMLVKWLLCPSAILSKNVAPGAFNQRLADYRGITEEGRDFAIEHVRRYLASLIPPAEPQKEKRQRILASAEQRIQEQRQKGERP